MSASEQHVETLIEKAAQAAKAVDALQFSQAASNAAAALCGLANVRKNNPAN